MGDSLLLSILVQFDLLRTVNHLLRISSSERNIVSGIITERENFGLAPDSECPARRLNIRADNFRKGLKILIC